MKEKFNLRKAISFVAASSVLVGAMSAAAPVAQAAPTVPAAGVSAIASKPYTPCPYSSSSNAHPQIWQGSTGKAVTHLQCLLQVMGYGHVAQDGIFGSKTDGAVRAFQKAHKLAPDGIVGPKTWNSLHAAVKKKLG